MAPFWIGVAWIFKAGAFAKSGPRSLRQNFV